MLPLDQFENIFSNLVPRLGATKNNPDPLIICKFYDTKGKDEWYIIEAEKAGDTYILYGYIVGKENKMGKFSLKELEERKSIMLSLLSKPCPLSYIRVSGYPEDNETTSVIT